jgi:hypothetical protein
MLITCVSTRVELSAPGASRTIAFFLGFDFLEEFLPPVGIGLVQSVDDDRHQIGKSLQVDLNLACNHIPAPVVSNAIMDFIALEVNARFLKGSMMEDRIVWVRSNESSCRNISQLSRSFC